MNAFENVVTSVEELREIVGPAGVTLEQYERDIEEGYAKRLY